MCTAYDLEQALAIRVLVGNATLYPLIGASSFFAGPVIGWMRRKGFAPSTRTVRAATP